MVGTGSIGTGSIGTGAIGIAALAMMLVAGATPARAGVAEGNIAWAAGNYDKAVAEWRPAADAGSPEAQFNLAQAYKLGRGVTLNMAEAEKWYRKAADQGFAEAQDLLGLMLFRQGDRAQAMPLIEKSAARGEPRAMYVLGTAKFNGDFAAKDWPGAYALMRRAADAGVDQAKSSLQQMDRFLSPADKAASGYAPPAQVAAQDAAPAPMAVAPAPATPRVPTSTGASAYTPINPAAAPAMPPASLPPMPSPFASAPVRMAQAAPDPVPPAYQQPVYQPPAYQPPAAAPMSGAGPTVDMGGTAVAVPGAEVNVRPDPMPQSSAIRQVPLPAYVPPAAPPPMMQSAPPPAAPDPVAPPPRVKPRPAAVAVHATGGSWKVQLGAFATPGGARDGWTRLAARIPALGGMTYAPQAFGAVTRLQASGAASRAQAQAICRAVVAKGNGCFPVAP